MTAALAERPQAESMNETPRPEWEQRSELTLAALPSAVSCARLLVRSAALRLQLDARSTAAMEEITDALVIHSVVTTGVSEMGPLDGDAVMRLRLLVVRLRFMPDRAMVEVWDRSREAPHSRLGRLYAVQMADDWGFELFPSGQRAVWCATSLTFDTPNVLPALPRRIARRVTPIADDEPPLGAPDPALLKRVLEGLRRLGSDGD
ncbi:hypothetical protein [Actinophytocola sp.]|uniref:hypothetical protein n=1 Tax=Actinophytocola sp. TaxID=1872138 RepID=UPI003D6B2295